MFAGVERKQGSSVFFDTGPTALHYANSTAFLCHSTRTWHTQYDFLLGF